MNDVTRILAAAADGDPSAARDLLPLVYEELRQLAARKMSSDRIQDHPRFQFPSVDGAEMVSRWDMQCHPPDILITNVSMLSAMLVREVDAPIFDKTRKWLMENEYR